MQHNGAVRYACAIDDLAPTPSSRVLRIAGAVGVLVLFLVTQGAVYFAAVKLGAPDQLAQRLTIRSAAWLTAVQTVQLLLGIAIAISLLGLQAVRVWLGARGTSTASALLIPVALVMLAPTIALALWHHTVVSDDLTAMSSIMFVGLAAAVALNEELWFRGLLVRVLGGAAHPVSAVVVSALIFGVPHIGERPATWLNAAVVTLTVGIPFAVARLRAGTIWGGVLWHFVIDAWAFVHTSKLTPSGHPSVSDIVTAAALPALIAAGYLLVGLRRDALDRRDLMR